MTQVPTQLVDLLFPLNTPGGKITRVTVRPFTVEEYEEFQGQPCGMWRALARAAGLPPELGASLSDCDAERIGRAVDATREEYKRRVRFGLPQTGASGGVCVELTRPVDVPGGHVERLCFRPMGMREGELLKRGLEGEVTALAASAGVSVEVILELDESDLDRACAAANKATRQSIIADGGLAVVQMVPA